MKSARSIVLFASVFACACASTPKRAGSEPTPDSWGALLATTDSLVNAGRHAAADSVLRAFESAHAGTRAAGETLFWRALYKLDPRSLAATRAEGRALMDAYAASPNTSWYRPQANVLRHMARAVEAAGNGSSDTTIVIGDTSSRGVAARDLVIRNQRAEIARLNDELERIKRRLATPTP